MTWQIAVSLMFLGLALVGGLLLCILTSVNAFARRLTDEPKVRQRRGFEVKLPAVGERPAVGDEPRREE